MWCMKLGFFWKINFCCFFKQKIFNIFKKWDWYLWIKKYLFVLFKGKVLKVYQVNSKEKVLKVYQVNSKKEKWVTLGLLKYQVFPSQLSPPSPIFFKKNEIDFFKKNIYYMQGKKMRLIFFNFLMLVGNEW